MNTSCEAARILVKSQVEISLAALPFPNFLTRREGNDGSSIVKYCVLANPASNARYNPGQKRAGQNTK